MFRSTANVKSVIFNLVTFRDSWRWLTSGDLERFFERRQNSIPTRQFKTSNLVRNSVLNDQNLLIISKISLYLGELGSFKYYRHVLGLVIGGHILTLLYLPSQFNIFSRKLYLFKWQIKFWNMCQTWHATQNVHERSKIVNHLEFVNL